MDKYLLQKAIDVDNLKKEQKVKQALEFNQGLNSSNIERNIVPDFQEKLVKDLPVDKINKLGEIVPVQNAASALSNAAELQAQKQAEKIKEGRKNAIKELAYDAGASKQEYLNKKAQESGKKVFGKNAPVDLDYNQLRKSMRSGGLKAIPGLGLAAQVTPALADLKEGNVNTAAARLTSGLAPLGSEQLSDNLMEQAQLQDKSPELSDPGYLKTLQAIGERRAREGKSPIVESFSGQQVDTSATEDSDILNKIKAKMRENSQG